VRLLLREPRPQVHYKSQPDATAQRETQKSTNVHLVDVGNFLQLADLAVFRSQPAHDVVRAPAVTATRSY